MEKRSDSYSSPIVCSTGEFQEWCRLLASSGYYNRFIFVATHISARCHNTVSVMPRPKVFQFLSARYCFVRDHKFRNTISLTKSRVLGPGPRVFPDSGSCVSPHRTIAVMRRVIAVSEFFVVLTVITVIKVKMPHFAIDHWSWPLSIVKNSRVKACSENPLLAVTRKRQLVIGGLTAARSIINA